MVSRAVYRRWVRPRVSPDPGLLCTRVPKGPSPGAPSQWNLAASLPLCPAKPAPEAQCQSGGLQISSIVFFSRLSQHGRDKMAIRAVLGKYVSHETCPHDQTPNQDSTNISGVVTGSTVPKGRRLGKFWQKWIGRATAVSSSFPGSPPSLGPSHGPGHARRCHSCTDSAGDSSTAPPPPSSARRASVNDHRG